jgi:hypothetical protein
LVVRSLCIGRRRTLPGQARRLSPPHAVARFLCNICFLFDHKGGTSPGLCVDGAKS